jgi:DNA-binding MarR family transcriptional regulator
VRLPDELLEHSESIDALRAIARVRWLVMDVIGREVKVQEGLPYEWFEVFVALVDSPEETLRMTDLAGLTLRSKSAMTRLVDRMEAAGLLHRKADPVDRRSILVTLTTRGRALIERATPRAAGAMIDRFTSHMSPEEARYITSVLNRILLANGVELGTDPDPGTPAKHPAPSAGGLR